LAEIFSNASPVKNGQYLKAVLKQYISISEILGTRSFLEASHNPTDVSLKHGQFMGMLLSQYKDNKSLLFIIKYISIKLMYGIGQRLFLLSDFAVN